MSQITANVERTRYEWAVWKRRAVYGFIMLSVFIGLALALVPKESSAFAVVQVVASVAVAVLYVLWFFADSLEGDYPVGRLLTFLILLAPYIGVPVYVFRGRGFKKGSAMLARMFAFILLLVLVVGITKEAVVYFVF
jgi:hypothetical protein